MKILPLSTINRNIQNSSINCNGRPRIYKDVIKKAEKGTITTAIVPLAGAAVAKILEKYGITYCKQSDDNCINLNVGYNGGFYKIRPIKDIKNPETNFYIAAGLNSGRGLFGGLRNYMECVKDLKRQDLIQKALMIHTYEINNELDSPTKCYVAEVFSSILDQKIIPSDLFFIEEDAFYYDKPNKTVYFQTIYNNNYDKSNISMRKCKFITNDKNNAIGYVLTDWNKYTESITDKEYIEQQAPSENLPEIVDYNNNKRLAEAFRFGNVPRMGVALRRATTEIVLPNLRKALKNDCISIDDITITKFMNNDGTISTRICYYDSSIGHSIVYNEEGKYLYQLEYVKYSSGNIKACSKL